MPIDASTSVPVLRVVAPLSDKSSASCGVRTKDCGGGVRGVKSAQGYIEGGMFDVTGAASGEVAGLGAVDVVGGNG